MSSFTSPGAAHDSAVLSPPSNITLQSIHTLVARADPVTIGWMATTLMAFTSDPQYAAAVQAVFGAEAACAVIGSGNVQAILSFTRAALASNQKLLNTLIMHTTERDALVQIITRHGNVIDQLGFAASAVREPILGNAVDMADRVLSRQCLDHAYALLAADKAQVDQLLAAERTAEDNQRLKILQTRSALMAHCLIALADAAQRHLPPPDAAIALSWLLRVPLVTHCQAAPKPLTSLARLVCAFHPGTAKNALSIALLDPAPTGPVATVAEHGNAAAIVTFLLMQKKLSTHLADQRALEWLTSAPAVQTILDSANASFIAHLALTAAQQLPHTQARTRVLHTMLENPNSDQSPVSRVANCGTEEEIVHMLEAVTATPASTAEEMAKRTQAAMVLTDPQPGRPGYRIMTRADSITQTRFLSLLNMGWPPQHPRVVEINAFNNPRPPSPPSPPSATPPQPSFFQRLFQCCRPCVPSHCFTTPLPRP